MDNDMQQLIAMLMSLGGDNAQKSLDFQDDQLNTIMDPAFFAALSGGVNMDAFAPTIQEELIEGDHSGRMKLEKIASSPQDSVEKAIAIGLLEGMSSSQVIAELEAAGKIAPIVGADGFEDRSNIDRYQKWADDQWDSFLTDTEDQVTRTEVPSELAQKFIDSGFTNPAEQYTAMNVDPSLQGRAAETLQLKDAADAMARLRDAGSPDGVRAREMVGRMEQLGASTPSFADRALGNVSGLTEAVTGGSSDPSFWDRALGRGGGSSRERDVMSVNAGGMMPSNSDSFGLPDQLKNAFLSKMDAARRQPASPTAGPRPDRAAMWQAASGANREFGQSQASVSLDHLKAAAEARALQEQGRSPFIDEYVARLAATRR